MTGFCMRLRGRFTFVLMLGVMSFLGCVRVEAKKETPVATRLVVTRDTHGVRMQFQSIEGRRYSIYYRDTNVPNDEWKLLPNASEIPGTGDIIKLSDPSPDAFLYRKYRIMSLIPVGKKDPDDPDRQS